MRRMVAATAWILVAACAADAMAQQESVQVRGRRWKASLDGDMQADNGGITGTGIDLRSSLHMTDEPEINDYGALFNFPGLGKVNFQLWRGSFESKEVTLNQDLTFAGTTFSSGTLVDSTLHWHMETMMLEYDPSAMMVYGIPSMFAIDFGVKSIDFKGQIQSATEDKSSQIKGYLPIVGVHGHLQPSTIFSIEVDANGLLVKSTQISGVNGTLADIAVSAQVTFSGFYGGVGYRWFKLKAEDDRTDVDTSKAGLIIKGFFLEVGLKW